MALPDIFDPSVTLALCDRIKGLDPRAAPLWGRLDAARMLAHCCTPYEQLRGEKGGGGPLVRWIARLLFKETVTGERPFRRNLPTAKAFQVADPRDFQRERERLLGHIAAFHGEGRAAFEGRPHVSFGPLTARQWSNLLWKHLDHHLRQFGS